MPKDKVKKVTKFVSLVDGPLAKELRTQGAFIARERVMKYYCVSCAVHRGVVKVRSKTLRRSQRVQIGH